MSQIREFTLQARNEGWEPYTFDADHADNLRLIKRDCDRNPSCRPDLSIIPPLGDHVPEGYEVTREWVLPNSGPVNAKGNGEMSIIQWCCETVRAYHGYGVVDMDPEANTVTIREFRPLDLDAAIERSNALFERWIEHRQFEQLMQMLGVEVPGGFDGDVN